MTADDGLQELGCSNSVDKGSNTYVQNIPLDILDSIRIRNQRVDMGAYEAFSNLPVNPVVTIVASDTAICTGTSVKFTSTVTAANGSTTYQWKINDVNAGTNSNVFTTSNLRDGDVVKVVITVNSSCLSTQSVTSSAITVHVNSTLTATVSIISSANPACAGSTVSFTAIPVNGGPTPSYQWKLNGTNAGTNSNTFTSANLSDNDNVSVVLTSSLSCVTNNPVAGAIVQHINPAVQPSVSISSGAITCPAASVTFTATAVNGGTNPSYQWKVNGVNAATNSNTFTSATLSDNDVVTVVMTSNASCVTLSFATSAPFVIHFSSSVTPAVSISSSSGNLCLGNPITFTATSVNGGPIPSYQWKVNGVNAGTNSNTFTSNSFNDNDVLTVVMTSNATCSTTSSATSAPVVIHFPASVTPSVSISMGSSNSCSGSSITFTANPVNGGPNPSYQWKVNGVNAGTNSATFTSATLSDNDVVTVVMTSNASCVTSPSGASAPLIIHFSSSVTSSVSITSFSTTICAGTAITFTAVPVNGGTNPSFQWQVNNVNAGANAATFTTSNLLNNSQVKVILTSSLSCSTGPVTSNVLLVTVNQPVLSSIVISGNTTVSSGQPSLISSVPNSTGGRYQWQDSTQLHGWRDINGAVNNFINYVPANSGDKLRCVLTNSTASCTVNNSALSNTLTFRIAANTGGRNYNLRIYPNPASSTFTIDTLRISNHWSTIEIMNPDGRILTEKISITNKTSITVNVGRLTAGLYFALLTTEDGEKNFNKIY